MTKGALNILRFQLAKESWRTQHHRHSLAPGFTETHMSATSSATEKARQFASSVSALGRVGQPDAVAAVPFLASHDGGPPGNTFERHWRRAARDLSLSIDGQPFACMAAALI